MTADPDTGPHARAERPPSSAPTEAAPGDAQAPGHAYGAAFFLALGLLRELEWCRRELALAAADRARLAGAILPAREILASLPHLETGDPDHGL